MSSQPPVHRHRLALCVLLVTFSVFVLLLFPLPIGGRSTAALGDLVHAPLFGSLAIAWFWTWHRLIPFEKESSDHETRPRAMHPFFRAVIVWVTLSLFGLGMEVLQAGTGRSASIHDALANSLGVAAALAGYTGIWLVMRRRLRVASVFVALCVTILAIAWSRPVMTLADVVSMSKQFPMLASYESMTELSRWYQGRSTGRLVREDVTDGRFAYEVDFQTVPYSFITLVELVPDWSGHRALEFDATLDSKSRVSEVTVLIKIFDERDGEIRAFVKTVTLTRGRGQHVRVRLAEFEPVHEGDSFHLQKAMYVEFGLLGPRFNTTIRFDRLMLSK